MEDMWPLYAGTCLPVEQLRSWADSHSVITKFHVFHSLTSEASSSDDILIYLLLNYKTKRWFIILIDTFPVSSSEHNYSLTRDRLANKSFLLVDLHETSPPIPPHKIMRNSVQKCSALLPSRVDNLTKFYYFFLTSNLWNCCLNCFPPQFIICLEVNVLPFGWNCLIAI